VEQIKPKKKWSQEQIGHRCSVRAPVGAPQYEATACIIPSFIGGVGEGGYGDGIQWDVRLFRKGDVVSTGINRNNLMSVGCSEEDADSIVTQVNQAADFLRRTYPVMKPGMERKPGFVRWAPSD